MDREIQSISQIVYNLCLLDDELSCMTSGTDNDIQKSKKIVDCMMVESHKLLNDCTDLSNRIQETIVTRCEHNYVPDSCYFDPCRSFKKCQNCGNVV